MIIRNLKNQDVSKIFDLWNEFLPHESASKQNVIRKIFLDVNFDRNGFFVAEEDESIVGFCNCVYHCVPILKDAPSQYPNGYINILAIKNDDNFDVVGNRLLETAENYFKSVGKEGISTAYFPIYFVQGVNFECAPQYAKLYESRGYSVDKSATLDINLAKFNPLVKYEERKKSLEKEGFYIGPLTDEYLLSALDPNEPFSSYSWSAEFRNRIMQNMDYESMRIAAFNGHVIGACIFGDPLSSPERFGPFGVDGEYQGKGIGSVLLHDCLKVMKSRNLHSAWMQWVHEDGTAWHLYNKFGFTKTYTYHTYIKKF